MTALVVSDTHGDDSALRRLLNMYPHPDMLIHAGDADGSGPYYRSLVRCPVHIVTGNNDYGFFAASKETFRFAGHTIFLTHGHRYNIYRSLDSLLYAAEEAGADIVIFGHTHIPVCERQGDMLILNPGSLTYPRQAGHRPSYILLTVSDGGAPDAKLLYL